MRRWRHRIGSRRSIWRFTTKACLPKIQHAGSVFVGAEQSGGRGRLRVRSESCAADFGRGADSRRTVGGRFREGDFGAGTDVARSATNLRRRSRRWRAPKAWKRMRDRWRCGLASKKIDLPPGVLQPREAVLKMAPYHPPTGGRADKLRLDFNENTVGCSPKVIEYLREQSERRRAGDLSGIRRGQAGTGRVLRGRAGRLHR